MQNSLIARNPVPVAARPTQRASPPAAARRAAAPPLRAAGEQLCSKAMAAGIASLLLLGSGAPAEARQPPIQDEAGRCSLQALDKFAGELRRAECRGRPQPAVEPLLGAVVECLFRARRPQGRQLR
jgi:hypothetical protein